MIKSVGIALLAFLFGSASSTVAELMLVGLHEMCGGQPPKPDWIAEAGVIIVAIGFAVLLFFRAQAAVVSGKTAAKKEVVTTAAVGLAGGFVAILKVWLDARRTGRLTDWDISEALIILAVVTAIFLVAGLLMSKAGRSGPSSFAEFGYRAAIAILIAGGAGMAIQLVFLFLGMWSGYGNPIAECSEKNLTGLFRYGTASFFISAPMAAMILALYAFASAYVARRTAQTFRPSYPVLAATLIGAAVLSGLYALSSADRWPAAYTAYALLMLQMPATWGAIISGSFASKASSDLRGPVVTAIIAFCCAMVVAWPFIPTENMTTMKALAFSLAHAATAFSTTWAVTLAISLDIPNRKKPAGAA